MKKAFSETAFQEYIAWQSDSVKIWEKINELIKSVERDGAMKGLGKPEKLRYRKGLYSRRIDEANRLVYEISDDVVTILRCKGHYDD